MSPADPLRRARAILARTGLLLLQDARVPSLCTLLAGGPIRGSWWGHPAGHAIFHGAGALADDPDVLVVPLLDRKVTFVHRRLWPALLGVASARADWQVGTLTPAARRLLARVERAGRVREHGPLAKALARTLCVHGEQVHTESGAHALDLVSWARLARVRRIGRAHPDAAARAALQAAAAALAGDARPRPTLPWE